jgi:hypothetical protein
MNFKLKYKSRSLLIHGLGLFFTFTLALFVYIKIKYQMLDGYADWLPRHFEKREILPLYWWFLLTIPVDIRIRFLLLENSKSESN